MIDHGHHHDHVHDSAVSSVSIVSEGTLDLDEVITYGLNASDKDFALLLTIFLWISFLTS